MSARVLVVEDDPSVRSLLDILLTGEGYDVQTASDGTEALQLAATQAPELILLDVMMPDVDGLGVLEKLRSETAFADIAIVVVTGTVDLVPELRERLGEDHVFVKPFIVADLLDRVAAVVGGSAHSEGQS